MTRRVLAALGCTALVLVLTVRAEPPANKDTPKRGDSAKIDAKPVDASTDNAIGRTSTLAREYKEFESLLLNLALRMEKSPRAEDKAKAEALRAAIQLANQENVENRFSKLLTTLLGKDSTHNLTTDDLEKAAGQNDELIKILDEMLKILLTDSELLKKQAEIKRLEEMIKAITKQIHDEKVIQTVHEGGKVDKKTVGKEQQKVTAATASIARQMGAPKPNENKDGKEGESKDGKGDTNKAEAKDDAKDPKSDPKDAKPTDPKDAKAGDPKSASDSKSGKPGDPKDTSDSKSGKPGDPKDASDAKSPPKPGDPKKPDQQPNKDQKPSDGKSKPENKADAKPGDGQGKPSDGQPKQAQSKPSQGSPQDQQAQSKPNGNQQAKNQPNSQNPPPPDMPGKKQVQDANDIQKQVEKKIQDDKKDDASKGLDDVIAKLEEAKKELEKRLRQLREEELERLLANLQGRCERMLAAQIAVYEGTKQVDAVVKTYSDKKPTRAEEQRSQQLSTREGDIVREANNALRLLESEGSAVSFAMVMESTRDDMIAIERRLDKYVTNESTQHIEEDVIQALKDMIEALKQAQQKIKDDKNKPPPSKSGPPPPKNLIDILAELKLIKSMQLQVNKRTTDNGKKYEGEQADDKIIQEELNSLSKKQAKLEGMLKDIATGKNR